MTGIKQYVIFILFIFQINNLFAQEFTGTWEGKLKDGRFLQMNMLQIGNKLCGYTWDYYNDRTSKSDQCKAYFTASYNKKYNIWFLTGTSFIENRGQHNLMRLRIRNNFINGKNVIEGIDDYGDYDDWRYMDSTFFSEDINEYDCNCLKFKLKKVSEMPAEVLENMKDCFEEKKKSMALATIVEPAVKKADTSYKSNITTSNDRQLTLQMNDRTNKEVSRIKINTKNIKLSVYDNATVDGDTVSIFYNGKLILSHQRLSDKPIDIDLVIDENISIHKIVLFAENLGTISPNTALTIVNADGKRYELFSSASLKENAVLLFEYVPNKK